MTRFGRLLGLIVALGGFAAAHVLVQTGNAQVPVPTVSVTTPALPVPPVPPPPPPPPPPTTTVPVPPVPPVPPPPALPVPPPTRPAPVPPAPVPAPPPVPVPVPPPPARPAPPPPPGVPTVPTSAPSPPTVPTTPAALRSAPAPAAPGSSEPAGTVGAPSSAAATAAAPGSAAGSGSSAGPSGSAAAPSAGGGSPASQSAGARATTPQKLEARRLKTRDRVSVRLEFSLPKADRIFVIVRGPSPSCRIAGYIPIRGRKGPNTVAFAGRVHGRRLEPGIYLISLSPNRRLVPGAPTAYIRVVSPRRSIPLPESVQRPSCREAGALATDVTPRILIAEAVAPPATPTVRPTLRPLPPRPTVHQGGRKDDDDDEEEAAGFIPYSDVLGAATGDRAKEPFVALAMLTIMAAFLIGLLMLVTRLLRGSRNP